MRGSNPGFGVGRKAERTGQMRTRTLLAAIGAIGVLGLAGMPVSADAQLFDSSNWSFENGLTNWTVYDPVDRIMVSSDFARTGTNSLLFATTNRTLGGYSDHGQYDVTSEGGVTVGISYTGTVYYYLSSVLSSNESLGADMTFYSVAGNTWTPIGPTVWAPVYGPDQYGPQESVAGTWTQLKVVATAPVGADAIQFGMEVLGRGSDVYFDDVQVVPEPASWLLILGAVGGLAFLRRRLHGHRR